MADFIAEGRSLVIIESLDGFEVSWVLGNKGTFLQDGEDVGEALLLRERFDIF